MPQMLPVAYSYPTHNHVASVDSSMAGTPLFSPSVSLQGTNPPPTHMNYPESFAYSHLPTPTQYVEESEQSGSLFNSDAPQGFWSYGSPALQGEEGSLSHSDHETAQRMHHLSHAAQSALPLPLLPAYDSMPPPPITPASDFSYGRYMQPSSEQYSPLVSNKHSPSLSPNNTPLHDFHTAHQFIDFNDPPTMHPSGQGISLESFPNIVEDEDGRFRIEESDSSRSFNRGW